MKLKYRAFMPVGPFKKLSYGKTKSGGRNSSGSITIYHRGGGSKRLHRRIDFQRNTLYKGVVERIEYDPNRSSKIALIRWGSEHAAAAFGDEPAEPAFSDERSPIVRRAVISSRTEYDKLRVPTEQQFMAESLRQKVCFVTEGTQWASNSRSAVQRAFFSYILACENLKSGDQVMNLHLNSKTVAAERIAPVKLSTKTLRIGLQRNETLVKSTIDRTVGPPSIIKAPVIKDILCGSEDPTKQDPLGSVDSRYTQEWPFSGKTTEQNTYYDSPKAIVDEFLIDRRLYQKTGNNCTIGKLPVGSIIHNVEIYPGQGGQLVRAAGTFAQLVQKFDKISQCMIRLPSGRKLLLDSRCRATLGSVSAEGSHRGHDSGNLKKAGQNRWLGRRPVVRGVAMNPIDHPHGGGEGRTKGGRPSVSPWGKPTKGSRRKSRKATAPKAR